MKIFLPISLDRYGSPISSLLREIALRNRDIDFHAFSRPDAAAEIEVREEMWRQPNIHRESAWSCLKEAYDLAHVASATWRNVTFIRAARLRAVGRTKVVYTANVEPHDGDPHLPWMRWLVKNCDFLVSVSAAVAASVEARWGRKTDAIVPNGADPAFFIPAVTPPEAARPAFVYLGTVTKRKRPDVVIEIARRMPEADFTFVGPPGLEGEPAHYAALARGVPNVTFTGGQTRKQVRAWLQNATAVLFPSDVEGLPLSIVEAHMTGVPVVAQPVTCMPEIITEGRNGSLIPASDVEGWVRCSRDLAANPENRHGSDWRRGIREAAVSGYSWDSICRTYGDLYRDLCPKRLDRV